MVKVKFLSAILLCLLISFSLWFFTVVEGASPNSLAIEWLEFKVPVGEQAEFIRQDRSIWDKFLSQYPAFLGKEIWQDINNPDRLIIVARWSSYQEWKSIPDDKVKEVTDRFHRALGKEYPIISSHAFRLR